MAILKGKGCTLQQTISSTLTDVAQVISLSVSGEASDTFETTTLGGVVYKTFSQTGYSSPGTVDAELFFDPALAGHVTIVALISTPADCVWPRYVSTIFVVAQQFAGVVSRKVRRIDAR